MQGENELYIYPSLVVQFDNVSNTLCALVFQDPTTSTPKFLSHKVNNIENRKQKP